MPSLICALSCHLRNLSMPRPSCHFPAMPLPHLSELCLSSTPLCYAFSVLFYQSSAFAIPTLLCNTFAEPSSLRYAFAVPTLLCSAIADQNLTMPSHTIYAPYAIAHRHPSLLCRRHPESCPCYDLPRHCTTVHSCASAILCLAPIRCAFAFNPVSCIAPAMLYFVPPSQCKLFGTKPLHYCTSLRRTKPSLRHVTPLRICAYLCRSLCLAHLSLRSPLYAMPLRNTSSQIYAMPSL